MLTNIPYGAHAFEQALVAAGHRDGLGRSDPRGKQVMVVYQEHASGNFVVANDLDSEFGSGKDGWQLRAKVCQGRILEIHGPWQATGSGEPSPRIAIGEVEERDEAELRAAADQSGGVVRVYSKEPIGD